MRFIAFAGRLGAVDPRRRHNSTCVSILSVGKGLLQMGHWTGCGSSMEDFLALLRRLCEDWLDCDWPDCDWLGCDWFGWSLAKRVPFAVMTVKISARTTLKAVTRSSRIRLTSISVVEAFYEDESNARLFCTARQTGHSAELDSERRMHNEQTKRTMKVTRQPFTIMRTYF